MIFTSLWTVWYMIPGNTDIDSYSWYFQQWPPGTPVSLSLSLSLTFCGIVLILRWYQSSTADGECNSLWVLLPSTFTRPSLTFLQKSHSMRVNKWHFVLWDKCRRRWRKRIESVKAAKYFSVKNNWKSFCSCHIFSDFSFACNTVIGG